MPIGYGKVVGKVVRIVGDGPDEGREPDTVGATAVHPRFTPAQGTFKSAALGALVSVEPVACTVDTDGTLLDPQGAPGVWLLTGAYRVELVGSRHGAFDILVTEEHTDDAPLDLFSAAPYVPPTGVTVQTIAIPAGGGEGQALVWRDGSPVWESVTGGGGPSVPSTVRVVVTTGTEPRPDADFVVWLGGTVQPTEMLEADLWLRTDPDPDPEPEPESPEITTTTLAGMTEGTAGTLTITATGTPPITWGLTGGALPSGLTISSSTGAISGTPTEAGAFTFTLTATNSAGSHSQEFTLDVTAANEPTPGSTHSIYGDTTPPTLTASTDGTPSITTATAFYTYPAEATGWRCVGGRQYIPEGSPAIGKTLTIDLHPGQVDIQDGEGADLSLPPARSGTTTTVEGWNQVTWAPYELTPSTRVYIASSTGDGTYHLNTDDLPQEPLQSGTGSSLYLAETSGYGNGPRSLYRIGSGPTSMSPALQGWYGQDILADEGAP